MRLQSATELGKSKEKSAIDCLFEALDDPSPKVRRQVVKAIGQINFYNPDETENLLELLKVLKEIQDLLTQLHLNQPNNSEEELVKQVISNPTFKVRLIKAVKSGGTEALKVFFPFISIPLETIRGFLEVE